VQQIYASFYQRILKLVDAGIPAACGNGSASAISKPTSPRPSAPICFQPWLDVVCDGYELPFATPAFPTSFCSTCSSSRAQRFSPRSRARVAGTGRLICSAYVSWGSYPFTVLLHHEPVAWRQPSTWPTLPRRATITPLKASHAPLFSPGNFGWPRLDRISRAALASSANLFSGGLQQTRRLSARCCRGCNDGRRPLPLAPPFAGRCLIACKKPPAGASLA